MNVSATTALRDFIGAQRQAALGTIAPDGAPSLAMVLYAIEQRPPAAPAALIHVSQLAVHTRQLLADPRASLLIMQPDIGQGDPQALPRVAIQCTATLIPRDSPNYVTARMHYLNRLPAQEYLFGFPDFCLFRLELHAARYIGGFAQAFSLDAATLARILTVA